jgi:superfamily II DNA/RNA helicase
VLKVACVLQGDYARISLYGGLPSTEADVKDELSRRAPLPLLAGSASAAAASDTVVAPPPTPTPTPTCTFGVLPPGLRTPAAFRPWRQASTSSFPSDYSASSPHVDVVLSTPRALSDVLSGDREAAHELLCGVKVVVVDECDLLLDGDYLQDLEAVLAIVRRSNEVRSYDGGVHKKHYKDGKKKEGEQGGGGGEGEGEGEGEAEGVKAPPPLLTRHAFVCATLPTSGLRSAPNRLARLFPNAVRLSLPGFHAALHDGLGANYNSNSNDNEGGEATTEWREVKDDDARFRQLCDIAKGRREGEGGKCMVFVNSAEAAGILAEALW